MDQAGESARISADWLRMQGFDAVDAVVVAGSGWQGITLDWAAPTATASMADVPEFPVPVAQGHGGEILRYVIAELRVLVLTGRTHLYEGRGAAAVVHGVRTAAELGCRAALLTNANGSLRSDWKPGTCVLVRDHLNLTATSPLTGPRFADLTEVYSPRLRAIARAELPAVVEGTYAMLRGPHYETRAEGSMLKALGADVIGMSTVLEAIAARDAGMEVLALSMVTVTEGEDIDPAEVVAVASAAATRLSSPVARVIAAIGR